MGINTDKAAKPVGSYVHAKEAGDLVFLSGVGPRHPVTDEIPVGIEAQTHAVFGNVLAILEAADLNSKDVDLAVQAADNARKSWSSLSIDERAQWLGKIAALGP